jgi:hypothetical protein
MEFDAGAMSTEHMWRADMWFLWLSTEHTFIGAWMIKYHKHKPLLCDVFTVPKDRTLNVLFYRQR